MPLKSVSLSTIPGGTPVKDFVKFQGHPVSAGKEAAFPSMVLACQKVHQGRGGKGENVFQSTLITCDAHTRESLNLSVIKPTCEEESELLSSWKNETYILTRNALLKRKACEPSSFESPAKIFSRMKIKAALAQQKNNPLKRLLETNNTTDCILTPERHPPPLGRPPYKDKDGLAEEPLRETENGRDPNYMAEKKSVHLTATAPLIPESPHKFFSRMKQKVKEKVLQTEDSSSYQIKESSSSAEAKSSLAALNSGKPLIHLPKEDANSAAGLDCSFIVEPVELGSHTFSAGVNDTDMSFGLAKFSKPVRRASPGKFPQEGKALPQGHWEAGQRGQQDPEVGPKQLCEVVFASPKIHIPRKRNSAGNHSKVPLKTSRTSNNEDTEEEQQHICLTGWKIKVINNNTAVCVEGMHKGMDNYWHSNAIVERLAGNQVRTVTGSVYVLEGRMDAAAMKKEGIPATFIKRFGNGIPKNWKKHVDELLHSLRRREEGASHSKDSKGRRADEGRRPSVKADGLAELPKVARRKSRAENLTDEVLTLSSPEDQGLQLRPGNLQIGSFTRSGRRVKPRLQYWCGERMLVDRALGVTITKGGTNYLTPSMNSTQSLGRLTTRSLKREKAEEEGPLTPLKERETKQPVAIVAKAGTLKRKQQMRDFLEQMPKDNHDDVFTATPLQNRNAKLPQFKTSEEDVFQLRESHPITPSSAIFPWMKTPQCEHVSPSMLESMDRKDYDKHVFQMQKNMKGKQHTWQNVRKKEVGNTFTTPTSRKVNAFAFNEGALGTSGPLFHGTQSEEEDEDFYFSS